MEQYIKAAELCTLPKLGTEGGTIGVDVVAELLPLRWRRADSRTQLRTDLRQRASETAGTQESAVVAPEQESWARGEKIDYNICP